MSTEAEDLLRRINEAPLPEGHGIDSVEGCMSQWFRQHIRHVMNIPVTTHGEWGICDNLSEMQREVVCA